MKKSKKPVDISYSAISMTCTLEIPSELRQAARTEVDSQNLLLDLSHRTHATEYPELRHLSDAHGS